MRCSRLHGQVREPLPKHVHDGVIDDPDAAADGPRPRKRAGSHAPCRYTLPRRPRRAWHPRPAVHGAGLLDTLEPVLKKPFDQVSEEYLPVELMHQIGYHILGV